MCWPFPKIKRFVDIQEDKAVNEGRDPFVQRYEDVVIDSSM
jgi:hypothetical protein